MTANVAELVRDIEGAAQIVRLLRVLLPPAGGHPVHWTRLQEDVTAHGQHPVRALLVLRRLAAAGLVEEVCEPPSTIPRYRKAATA